MRGSACVLVLAAMAVLVCGVSALAGEGATADPAVIPSGGTTQLYGPAVYDDPVAGSVPVTEWSWWTVDPTLPNTFSPSDSVQDPTWTAPGNPYSSPHEHHLGVEWRTCPHQACGYEYVTVTELAFPHIITPTGSADPAIVISGEATQLTANATDTWGHEVTFHWSDQGAGGEFLPSADVPSPVYRPPVNPGPTDVSIYLRLDVSCTSDVVVAHAGSAWIWLRVRQPWAGFSDLEPDYWAYDYIAECYYAGLLGGYDDGTYRPEEHVTRAQLAAFLARFLGLVLP